MTMIFTEKMIMMTRTLSKQMKMIRYDDDNDDENMMMMISTTMVMMTKMLSTQMTMTHYDDDDINDDIIAFNDDEDSIQFHLQKH